MSRFAVTLFVSATLLFTCQPMVGRMIVPLLGGAPAVWILCSLCFQALVLGGYFYAHVVGSRFAVRTQVLLQLVLIAAAFLVLPISVDEALLQSLTERSRSLGLLATLLRAVGLPFFVLSTTSPLLQRWYAELGETDPYHLYAASNAGSMVALLGYPFLIEPFVALRQQSRLLSVAFAGYTILVVVCAVSALRRKHPPAVEAAPAPAGLTISEDIGAEDPPASASGTDRVVFAENRSVWRDRLVWLMLAFVPSSLLMGATEFITADLASVPLLWVVPLALYLASFIVVFAKRQVVSQESASRALALIAAIVAVSKVAELPGPAWAIVLLHLVFLFVASVVCHRAFAVRRPHHTRLTEFYLVMSIGGVLGGAFNGLVAPVLFNDLLEYPIAIALALLARIAVDKVDAKSTWQRDVACGLGLAAVTFALVKVQDRFPANLKLALLWMYVAPVLFAFMWSRRPVRYAVAIGGILLVSTAHGGLTGNTIYRTRDFFGVLKVRRDPGNEYLLLLSGSTLHGAQSLDPAKQHLPLTYYYPTGPAGDVLGPLPDASNPGPPSSRRVGVIGLGVGSLAAYARPSEAWTFFELNPSDVDIAQQRFSYLSGMPAGSTVAMEVGDARLRLREGASQRFDVLVLDAFSSDAIPVHLMTREALVIYRRALAPGGILMAHISNRHVLLEPILAALANDAHLLAIGREELNVPVEELRQQKAGSHWVCLGDSQEALDRVAATNPGWKKLVAPTSQKVWTDDFANVLAAMHF
ncbi:MAG: hypothetical protein JWP97_4376 [Labilithrix sp.]|nr:hypothetical protein [Labilithrix sp.]